MCEQYYEKIFRPDVTTLVVIGKVTPERARAVIEKYFGQWQERADPSLKPICRRCRATKPAPPWYRTAAGFKMKLPWAKLLNSSARTTITMRCNSDCRFYPAVFTRAGYTKIYAKKERPGVLHWGAYLQSSKTRSVFAVSYPCDPPNVAKARALVERNLRMTCRPSRSPIPRSLSKPRCCCCGAFPLSESSIQGIAGGLLDRSLRDLALDEPIRAAKRYAAFTAARNVQTAFAKWLRLEDLAQVVLGPNPQ